MLPLNDDQAHRLRCLLQSVDDGCQCKYDHTCDPCVARSLLSELFLKPASARPAPMNAPSLPVLRYRITQAQGTETFPNDSYTEATNHDVENTLTMGVIWLTHGENTGALRTQPGGVILAFTSDAIATCFDEDPNSVRELLVATPLS